MSEEIARVSGSDGVQTGKRGLSPGRTVGALLLAAAAAFGSSLLPWITVHTHTSLNRANIEIAGANAAPAVTSLALVVMAAAVALRIAGPKIRWVVCAMMLIAAVGMGLSILSAVADPAAASLTEVAQATGMEGADADYSLSFWPWVAALCALVVFVVSLRAAWVSASWPVGRKYERNARPADTTEIDSIDTWDSLTAGIDPTR